MKAIREALRLAVEQGGFGVGAGEAAALEAAMREVTAIEKAAHTQRQLTVEGWCTAEESAHAEETWKSIADPDGTTVFPKWSPNRKG